MQITIKNKTKEAINSLTTENTPRYHLGVSLLGNECDRFLWLSFRWVIAQEFTSRILRIFRRGEHEENFVVSDLRQAGIQVTECLDNQQFIDFGCHVGGSPDGVALGVPEAPKTPHILEIKTHKDSSFKDVVKNGVQKSQPKHFIQMQCYMLGRGLTRALYYPVNKDTDDIEPTRHYFDKEVATKAIERGQRIALSDRLPPPLSTDKTWYKCKMCSFYNFCHADAKPTVSCRTCSHVSIRGKDIFCERWEKVLSQEEQLKGCRSHVIHPDLIHADIREYDQWNVFYDNILVGENGMSSKEFLCKS